ncbi:TPA: hypothetical protein ACMDXT_000022 [Vibrio parahaemolyticus]
MRNIVALALLPMLLTACQSTSVAEKESAKSLPSLNAAMMTGASLQLSALKCFDTGVALIQDEIEKETGVSFATAYNLKSDGYIFESIGCDSFSTYSSNVAKARELEFAKIDQERVKAEQKKTKELADKINRLNSVGKGDLKICSLGYSNKTHVYYDNRRDKRISLRTYDEYIVNSVYMNLNKSQARKFVTVLKEAQQKAYENSDIESLQLGKFEAGTGWVMLTSRNGKLSGFWGSKYSVDRVLLPLYTDKLVPCIEKLIPYI